MTPLAELHAEYEAKTADGVSADDQAEYAMLMTVAARTELNKCGILKRRVLFNLLCEGQPPEYVMAIRAIQCVETADANNAYGDDALYDAEVLMSFARKHYNLAEEQL